MPGFWENWPSPVNNCVSCARQNHEIYQLPPYSMDYKVHRMFKKPPSKTAFNKWGLFEIQDLQTYEMTIKLKSNINVGLINIFLTFDAMLCTCFPNIQGLSLIIQILYPHYPILKHIRCLSDTREILHPIREIPFWLLVLLRDMCSISAIT